MDFDAPLLHLWKQRLVPESVIGWNEMNLNSQVQPGDDLMMQLGSRTSIKAREPVNVESWNGKGHGVFARASPAVTPLLHERGLGWQAGTRISLTYPLRFCDDIVNCAYFGRNWLTDSEVWVALELT